MIHADAASATMNPSGFRERAAAAPIISAMATITIPFTSVTTRYPRSLSNCAMALPVGVIMV